MADIEKTRVSDEELITFLDYTYSLIDSSPEGHEAIQLYMAAVKLARSGEYRKRVFRNAMESHILIDAGDDVPDDDAGLADYGEVICD